MVRNPGLDRGIIGDFLGKIDADSYRAGKFLASSMVIGVESTFGLAAMQRVDFALALAWMTGAALRLPPVHQVQH